jgi:coniferyl-aldehyde dehydrogenase
VDASADIDAVAIKIAHGKLLNAGQTCIAPDYLMLPEGREAEFERAYVAAVERLFPGGAGHADYASIVSDRHHARLLALVNQARSQGTQVVEVTLPGGAGHARQMAPMLVFQPAADGRLLREEIFGPVLPVLSYTRIEDVIASINAGPRPLALYWFGSDNAVRDQVLHGTVSGGVTVNDTLLHIAHENLPFGGVGDSGWGAYHGETGFLRFTHEKSVMVQSRWAISSVFYPPYGARFDRVMGLLRRLL